MSKPIMPEVRHLVAGVCNYRMLIDGTYFGYVEGVWEKSPNQALSKIRYEAGKKA